MKKFLGIFLTLLLSVIICFYSYHNLRGTMELLGIFASGLLFGVFLMLFSLNVKNDKLNSYKRELEKESVSNDNTEAKVKVLESKIQVLEKALEKALNK